MRSGALVAVFSVAMAALASPVVAQAPAKVAAAQRRVDRQKQVLADHNARASKDADARARCTGKRSCARLDRVLVAHDTRRKTYERQLFQYEADARRLCAPS